MDNEWLSVLAWYSPGLPYTFFKIYVVDKNFQSFTRDEMFWL